MKSPVRLSQLVISIGMTLAMSAEALTLGRMTVLSSLGQPLIAEIEVPEISPEESNSIRVGMASPEAFKSAGLDYTPAAAQISVVGKRRVDGRAILELRSAQPITAPYLDLVLEVIWNTGRMLRDYTVLLDPPASSAQALVIPAPTLPIQTMSIAPVAQPQPAIVAIAAPIASAEKTALLDITSASPSAVTPKSAARPAASSSSRREGVMTKRGDTAAVIASNLKPEGVSLDQMLVAMLRSNPDAFVAGNVNRLKAGVVIEAPSAEDIRAIAPSDAKSSIQAQARDFNDYRRKLSSNVAIADVGQAARSASGKVVANVADRQATAPSDDRLTLAKPNAGTKTALTETKIAQERASADASTRAAELKKNIAELSKLNDTIAASSPATPTSTSPANAVSTPVAPAIATLPAIPKPNRPPPPPPEVSFLDQLILNPLTLPIAGGVGLLVLIAGWLGIRRRRASVFGVTQNSTQSFAVTRQPSDTIFGPMGASDVDTKDAPASTTMVYSPSQLSPTTGDVDPIAEADVYLAYNRDVQAEEILKAAKIDSPRRTDVQVKLLELYAKRQDVDSFNLGAQELHLLTDGAGDDWARVRQLAKEIGSAQPLFNLAPVLKPAAAPELPTKPSDGLIDFEPNSFSLNLPDFVESKPVPQSLFAPFVATSPTPEVIEDPKLALAEEYLSIGDLLGARALIEEVIAKNKNSQTVTQAHQMLAKLG